MYADDTKLYMRIKSSEYHKNFQTDVDRMYNWCLKWKMSLNVMKCAAIIFTNKGNYTLYDYSINNTKLQRVSTIKDLGVIFDSKLIFYLRTL
jgi:undecaprenyl pyrophosphate synthase